jgi:hypothetical protein
VTAEYTTGHGNLISQNRQGVESQYHFDALGSTLALTDDNQQVTDTNAYSAFGEVTEQTGTTSNSFQYGGQKGTWLDSATITHVRRLHIGPLLDGHDGLKSGDVGAGYTGNGFVLGGCW